LEIRGAKENPFQLLLVEDNPGDADLVSEAFKRLKTHCQILVVPDGESALRYLKNDAERVANPLPDLILLDFNLPRMHGREVLAELKRDEKLKQLPVIVFSSSEAERDLVEAYRLHANSFITKPNELSEYFRVVEEIDKFWFSAARLPPRLRFAQA
jgi:chemotaxis family two-component system response regulator Rcp1